MIEDASWLRKQNDSQHINMSELDAAIKGINMAVKWRRHKMNSATVNGWLRSVNTKAHNVHTRAMSELLIPRRLETIQQTVEKQNLELEVVLVPSIKNIADKLTRLPSKIKRIIGFSNQNIAASTY